MQNEKLCGNTAEKKTSRASACAVGFLNARGANGNAERSSETSYFFASVRGSSGCMALEFSLSRVGDLASAWKADREGIGREKRKRGRAHSSGRENIIDLPE